MSTLDAVKNIFEKNLNKMKDNLNTALSARAIDRLDEKKIEIAKNLFKEKE